MLPISFNGQGTPDIQLVELGLLKRKAGPLISDSDDLTRAVSEFSAAFHRKALTSAADGNYLASTLGVWLLLAQLAGANRKVLNEEDRFWAEQTLHMPLTKAFNLANRLLMTAPEAVKVASAAWVDMSRGEVQKEWVWNLLRSNASTVSEHMPSQEELDTWADEKTMGLIKKFPLEINPDVFFVLANAIATKIDWDQTFKPTQLKNSWNVNALLHENNLHTAYLIDDDRGRTFAVHIARGNDIEVLSVIAEDAAVPESDVLAMAEKLANHQIFPVHLPKGDSPLYTTRQRVGEADTYEVWLPAWSAKRDIDLTKLDLRLKEAARGALGKDQRIDAAQSVYAKYSKEGFEAAAVTGMMVMRSSLMPVNKSRVLHYQIKFDHPYAVVARWEGYSRDLALWQGLPLFSGIVREAEEA